MHVPDMWVFLADTVDSSSLANLNYTLIVIKRAIALLGSLIILIGAIYAISQFLAKVWRSPSKHQILNFDMVRLDLGRTILLGLEFIIAADIVETTTTPDYYSLGILGVLVLIRTFLNYSLNKELETLAQRQQAEKNELT